MIFNKVYIRFAVLGNCDLHENSYYKIQFS